MSTILTGYKRFTSQKNNKSYCVAYATQDITEREMKMGHVGKKAVEIWLPPEFVDLLKPEDTGKELKLTYEVSGDRFYLTNVAVK